MKKIFLIPFFVFSLFTFSSCEKDDSLDPRPLLVNGQFMKIEISKDRIDANDLANAYFGGKLSNPSSNVVRYELFVRVTRVGGELLSEYIPLETITSFPTELQITPAKIEQAYVAFGKDIAPLRNGDSMRFIAYSYDSAGNRAGYGSLSRTVQIEPGYKQAYRFNAKVTTDLNQPVNNYEP